MKAAIFCDRGAQDPELNLSFNTHFKARLQKQAELLLQVVTPTNFDSLLPELQDLDVIFTSWGMWELSPAQLAALPRLKAVFYAAGSVKYFASPLLGRGITVTSSWAANAVPVAEFVLAQILLANKGYFRNIADYQMAPNYYHCYRGSGNYGATISILGAGQVGRKLIELLRPFQLRTVVFDPFLSYKAAEILSVEKVETLEEAFACGNIVTNHLADVPATEGLIHGDRFARMQPNSTFINTGRGRTVNHEDLLIFLQGRSDVTALLDVTHPEPLPLSHPLRGLPNAHVSGHIAGSIGDEIARMGEFALQEFERWAHGKPLNYAVSLQMLETMA